MFLSYFYPEISSWPWDILVPLSFAVSFFIGCLIVCTGKSEGPVGTLFFATVGIPLIVATLWWFILGYAVLALICAAIGAKPSDCDSHGV